jgi:hypothetical protein
MRIRPLLIVVLLTLIIGGLAPISAGTIVGRLPGTVGNNWSLYSGQFLVSSWTQGSASNVSISAYLTGFGSFGFQLSTVIGPTATASDLVASNVMDVNQGGFAFLTVLSGLTLPANTYYLTAYGIGDASGSWPELVDPTVVGSLGNEFFTNDSRTMNSTDPYRSVMAGPTALSMGILVQDDQSSVPEPSSLVFVTTALAGLVLSLRRRV